MTVADAQHPAIIFVGLVALDFHESEIPGSIVAQAVGLVANNKAVGSESLLNMGYQRYMSDGSPGIGWPWRGDLHDLFAFHRPGPAM